jgi:hypothetical protein
MFYRVYLTFENGSRGYFSFLQFVQAMELLMNLTEAMGEDEVVTFEDAKGLHAVLGSSYVMVSVHLARYKS